MAYLNKKMDSLESMQEKSRMLFFLTGLRTAGRPKLYHLPPTDNFRGYWSPFLKIKFEMLAGERGEQPDRNSSETDSFGKAQEQKVPMTSYRYGKPLFASQESTQKADKNKSHKQHTGDPHSPAGNSRVPTLLGNISSELNAFLTHF